MAGMNGRFGPGYRLVLEGRRVGEPMRRAHRRGVLGPWLVRPGRIGAANDNVPVRRPARHPRAMLLAKVALMGLVLAAVLAVGACGRRGAPQLPACAADEPRVPLYATEPGGDEVPNRDFVLDPILQ